MKLVNVSWYDFSCMGSTQRLRIMCNSLIVANTGNRTAGEMMAEENMSIEDASRIITEANHHRQRVFAELGSEERIKLGSSLTNAELIEILAPRLMENEVEEEFTTRLCYSMWHSGQSGLNKLRVERALRSGALRGYSFVVSLRVVRPNEARNMAAPSAFTSVSDDEEDDEEKQLGILAPGE